MPEIKKPIIDYTGRDFASIKRELINYAQKYYPDTFKDFNEASFGSLITDLVSYVGDMLSFYTDYQANESFLETSLEFKNILKLAQQMGYKYRPNASSIGELSFFIRVPTLGNSVMPDLNYAPILEQGSKFASSNGEIFTLIEDVDFALTDEQILVAASNYEGTSPTDFALKAKGTVVSGELQSQEFVVGDYQKFLSFELNDENLTEIVQVFDADGNNWYEVDYLTQDVVYAPVLNTKDNKQFAKNILKPISVPRRFTAQQGLTSTTLQFGFGTSDNQEKILDPTSVILHIFGKNYFSDKSFDPAVLSKTSKLGLVPTNTVLTVIYRRNTMDTTNAAVGTINSIVAPIMRFRDTLQPNDIVVAGIISSLELTNEDLISGDIGSLSARELKLRAQGTHASQNRAVTKDDYINLVYNMPSNFGQVKRAMLTRDETSFNGKNLNLFVISTDSDSLLVSTNNIIKQNLKTWINRYKMIGDTIDILDAKVINLQIKYTVVGFANVNKYDIIDACDSAMSNYYLNYYYDIGEPFKISEVYKILNAVASVVDTKLVEVTPKTGALYSDFSVSYNKLISMDGRYLIPPEDVVFEIKYPGSDITGEVI